MITLEKTSNAIKFTFDDNGHYLQNGTIEVPINSLSMVIDESDMVTFKKSATNDIFVSARYDDFGMTKAELETFYKENMVGSVGGGGGITPQEVEEMIDEAVSGKADISDVVLPSGTTHETFTNLVWGSEFHIGENVDSIYVNNPLAPTDSTLIALIINNIEYSYALAYDWSSYPFTLTGMTGDETYVTLSVDNGYGVIKPKEGVRIDKCVSRRYEAITIVNYKIPSMTPSEIPTEVYPIIDDVRGDVDDLYNKHVLYGDSDSLLTFSESSVTFNLSAVTKSDSGVTDFSSRINFDDSLKRINSKLGVYASGNTISKDVNDPTSRKSNIYIDYVHKIEVTINQNYTGSTNTVILYLSNGEKIEFLYDPNTDSVTTYSYISAQFTYSYKSNTKDLTVEITSNGIYMNRIGCNGGIAPLNNISQVSSRIRLVRIYTNTLTLQEALDEHLKLDDKDNLNIGVNSSVSSWNSIVGGFMSHAKGDYSYAFGHQSNANKNYSHAEGYVVNANNENEFSFGRQNISSSASTSFGHSGNTLFSVGNGEMYFDNHNAFEIRQNGDIYIADTNASGSYSQKPMIKLQDQLGGGGGMTEDDELLLATALTDLNDRKIDASEVNSNYQKKGDYATKTYVTTALEPYETKLDEINTEEVAAYALNEINERLIALETAVQALQALHNNE